MSRKLISKQNEDTWASLHKRLMKQDLDYEKVFNNDVYRFLQLKSKSVGTNIGYYTVCVISSICFLISTLKSKITVRGEHSVGMNLFSIFVGPPSTGKSPAFKDAISNPLNDKITIISNATSSGLRKLLAVKEAVFMANPEIFEYLNKMLKNDDENAIGDSQILCKVFSNERCEMHFATEQERIIKEDCSFSILGATQIRSMAILLSMMDQGNGLLDRFLLCIPSALRTLPEEQCNAKESLQEINVEISDIYDKILNQSDKPEFYWSEEAQRSYDLLVRNFVMELNQALQEGLPAPKSKYTELVPKIAVAIHVLEHQYRCIYNKIDQPYPEAIEKTTFQRALYFVEVLEQQKDLFLTFIKEITSENTQPTRPQPTKSEIQTGILLMNGCVVTHSSFRCFAPRRLRGTTKAEYLEAIQKLEVLGAGSVENVLVHNSSIDNICFVKNLIVPDELKPLIDIADFNRRRGGKTAKNISARVLEELRSRGYEMPSEVH